MALGLGAKTVLRQSLSSGHGLPFWRADEFSGNAALADPQNAYLCPLNLLFWLCSPLRALGPTLLLYFLCAGLSGYAAGAMLGLTLWPRVLMGAAAMFNFKLIAVGYAGWLPSFPGVIVCPLFLAAGHWALEKPAAPRALALAAAAALCVSAGHAQLLYYCGLFLTLIALARLDRRRAAVLAGAAALAAGLSACVWLPLLRELPLISRGQASYEFFLSGHALRPRHLLTLIHPEILGTPVDGSYPPLELWEDAAYFGLIPLLLAAAGAFLGRRKAVVRALSALFLLSLVLALSGPWQRLLYGWLPGFRLFRIPARFLFLTGWFGIALAGFGLEEALGRLRGRIGAAFAAGLIAAILVEGASYARRYLPTADQAAMLPKTAFQEYFARHPGPYRIAPLGRAAVNYGWAAPMGLELVSGYSSFNYSRYQTFCDLLRWNRPRGESARVWTDISSISRPDLLDALNVRYLVSTGPADLPKERYSLAAKFPAQPGFDLYRGFAPRDLFVYENRRPLARAFFAEKVLPASDAAAAAALTQGADLRKTAVVEGSPVEPEVPAAEGSAQVVSARGGFLDLRVQSRAGGFLVISEVWHPGWTALLDGRQPIQLYPTDLALMGVRLPPREHRLTLSMRPPGWDIGLAVSALSAIVLLGASLWKTLAFSDAH